MKVKERITRLAEEIADPELRRIAMELLEEPRITFTKVEPKITFEESPAAPKKHHAYPGGLLDHTLGVAMIARSLTSVFESVYGASVDKDLVLCGAIIHDVFKYYQYEPDPITGGFRPRSDWYLSHDFALVAELTKRGAPDRLIRLVAEVHGTVPFTMIESQVVHQADSVDASFIGNLQDVIWYACRDIETETNGKYLAIKVFHEALRRRSIFDYASVYYSQGKDALREYIKKTLGLT